jgi:hypothetical protein
MSMKQDATLKIDNDYYEDSLTINIDDQPPPLAMLFAIDESS